METSSESTFIDIVGTILNNWTGLKMAIEHGMVGPKEIVTVKLLKIVELIAEFLSFSEKNDDWDHFALSDILSDQMNNECDTILEDNSTDEIASDIIQLHKMWLAGDKVGIDSKLDNLTYKSSILENTTHKQNFARAASILPKENFNAAANDNENGWKVVKRK